MIQEHRQELQRLADLSADEIGLNENNVKYNFIIPFLESFGYKKKLDFEHSAQGGRIDILIDKVSDHSILIEVKSYGKNLDDFIQQLKRYCDEERPVLAIISNGEEIRFYSPFWRKPNFTETLIYSVMRRHLSDEAIIGRIEVVLAKQFLEDGSVVKHIEQRENEISDIKKQMQSLDLRYQEKITTLGAQIDDLEEQIKSLHLQIDSNKTGVADLRREKEQEIEELMKQHLIHLVQAKQEASNISRETKPLGGRRPLGRKGYEQLTDYLIPVIRLTKSGVKHTDAFHKIVKELDVTYQTANAQCTVRLGNISTERFVELIKNKGIKSFLKERFPDKASLVEREL